MFKTYIILREDLSASASKLAIQVGHAIDILWLNKDIDNCSFQLWLEKETGDRRKIILKAKTLTKLQNLKASLIEQGFKCFDIVDSGYTELEKNTCTGIVVFPTQLESKNLNRLRCL